ncbi:MAG: hypothetical protein CMC08_10160 [Flavobacteriaceae bacterium]|nr:hypothetical protein [Flavobacteriaceae bacterium]|tara:strand:- start:71 stop:637 length:567 start_codon:yes stop_codon:yes gene_type:complete
MKNRIGELLVQIISVMIGVFLGFVVSSWSESSRENEKAALMKNNLRAELQNNKEKVEKVIDYHRMLRDSSRYYLRSQHELPGQPTFFRGVNTLTLSNSAFDTGVQTGLLNEMDLEKIQAINDVYTKQRAYEDFANLLLSGLISQDFEKLQQTIRKLLMYLSISMTDVVIKEEQLLESYEKALEMFEIE